MIIKCFTNNILLPAIEKLKNKKEFPRRYCIFYYQFFCGGLQKKKYLKKLIIQKESKIEPRFGACSFEAHVHNIMKQNYFVWIYDILKDPVLDVENKSLVLFKTDYDSDVTIDNTENSVCSCICERRQRLAIWNKQKIILCGTVMMKTRQPEENHV